MRDNNGDRENRNDEISSSRKMLYYGGMILSIVGFLMFFSVFLSGFSGNMPNMSVAPVGMLFIIGGSALMNIGKKGLSGSGLKLDPKEARKDLEPFSRQGGGMLSDAVDEFKSQSKISKEREIIKIKCRSCGALNDEDANFCDNCGEKL